MTRVDVAGAGIVECQGHLSLRGERTDHLGNFLQEIAEVYSVAVLGQRQRLVKSRGNLKARADIVEQRANLIRGKGFAALADGTALKANNAVQTGQVVRDPMIGFSQTDSTMFDGD